MTRSSITFEVLQTNAALAELEPEWRELFHRSGTSNPFAHPGWLGSWLETFVPSPDRRRILAARRNGELIGVAPFYYRPVGHGRTLQLAGAPIQEDPLTEVSEVLVLPAARRQLLPALVRELAAEHADGCDWLALTLPASHGWFNDDWIPDAWRRRGAFSAHKSTRPFSVMPLGPSWDELPLHRNLKNAINRAENRHARLADRVAVRILTGTAVSEGAEQVQRLHRLRATARRGAIHPDYFVDPRISKLGTIGVQRLAETDNACVVLCEIDGEPVAGRIALRAGGSAFVSYSGLDPRFWQLGSLTLLLVTIAQRAIEQGDRMLNLSLNPDPAKQRWTKQIEIHNEFVVVAPSRRSRLLFSLFWQARSARVLRQQIQRSGAERSDG
ncbi:MAG TPA: GNAT family N-acetyltransferase [Gaiellaceae bacterium]|jgi:CelD/BcsL family acetyltransferase involved in cellulose biosynthesis